MMLDRQSFIFWSVPVGKFFGVEFRLSWMIGALAILYVIQLGFTLGVVFTILITLIVLLHECGHVVAARLTNGNAEEIIISPIGGLAAAMPGPSHASQLWTASGGIIVNVALCALLYPGLYAPDMLPKILFLYDIPISRLHPEQLGTELCLLTFYASWFLLLINLLPVLPLDGGMILQTMLSRCMPPDRVFRGMIVAGFATAIAVMLGGLLANLAAIVVLGAIILVMNVMLSYQQGLAEYRDESFMGYDFSQGYTSLERSDRSADREQESGRSSWMRWKERRQARREQLAKERQEQDESQLDTLLAKVHAHGVQSLTSEEKLLLQRVSTGFRERSKRQT